MRVVVTGANGFVGRALLPALLAHGHEVRALTRHPDPNLIMPGVEGIATGPIEKLRDWRGFLNGARAVVHLAARVHVPEDVMSDEALIRAINTEATLALAASAAARGVERFVYVSTAKVHGEETPWDGRTGRPFRASDPLRPLDPYARSKAEAERGLVELAIRSNMAITMIRPPLVHGPGARANLRALIDLVARAPFLPFGAIDNRRSLVSADNLASAICTVLDHSAAAGRTYLVSDGEDLSTPELACAIAEGLGKKARLIPVPVPLLMLVGKLAGKEGAIRRLTESLQVDSSDIRDELGWRPVETAREGIAKAARWGHAPLSR